MLLSMSITPVGEPRGPSQRRGRELHPCPTSGLVLCCWNPQENPPFWVVITDTWSSKHHKITNTWPCSTRKWEDYWKYSIYYLLIMYSHRLMPDAIKIAWAIKDYQHHGKDCSWKLWPNNHHPHGFRSKPSCPAVHIKSSNCGCSFHMWKIIYFGP